MAVNGETGQQRLGLARFCRLGGVRRGFTRVDWRDGSRMVVAGMERRGGRVLVRIDKAGQAWLGAVWMESKGQAGFSRYGYWHGG